MPMTSSSSKSILRSVYMGNPPTTTPLNDIFHRSPFPSSLNFPSNIPIPSVFTQTFCYPVVLHFWGHQFILYTNVAELSFTLSIPILLYPLNLPSLLSQTPLTSFPSPNVQKFSSFPQFTPYLYIHNKEIPPVLSSFLLFFHSLLAFPISSLPPLCQ